MAKAKQDRLTIDEAILPIDEQPYELPENWCWVKHNSILDISGGSQPAKSHFISEPAEGYTQLYQTRDYGEHPIPVYIPDKYATKTTVEGDILLARYGGSLGKVFRAHDGAYNVALAKVIKLYPNLIDDEYLYKYYLSQFYQDFCIKASNGRSAQAGFNREDMDEIPFPLPPLAEQKRIVEQIENLFAKLDEAKDKVLDALDGFDSRKNAVLYKAFSGELSQTWRESNKVLKDTWSTVLLKELIVSGPQNGMYKEKSAYGDGIKILRIDGFYDGYIVAWDKLKRLTLNDEELEWYRLNVNDIVINRVNSMPYLGKSALVRELPEECVYESNMMRIKIDESKVYPEYLIKYLNSMMGLQELRKNAKQAVNQASINQQDVKNVKVILPSLDEQIEIVRLLELFTDEEVQAKERIESVIGQIDLMKKSILAKAFRGELGTNNTDEESAVESLKQILVENL